MQLAQVRLFFRFICKSQQEFPHRERGRRKSHKPNLRMQRLRALLKGADEYRGKPWILGQVPNHYKRITCTPEERDELAIIGQELIFENFGNPLYYSQAVIAGSILSDRYDTIVIVTPSQFGKSWTLARVGMVNASRGRGTYVAGANEDTTRIIMQKLIESLKDASEDLKAEMLTDGLDRLEKLGVSLSKKSTATIPPMAQPIWSSSPEGFPK